MNQSRSRVIEENPIGSGLDALRSAFKSVCEGQSIPCTTDALSHDKEDFQNLTLYLLPALRNLPAVRQLAFPGRNDNYNIPVIQAGKT
ncbi:hypothetical protein QBC46DRAFT_391155 [Diplogelasinospora grovesii]|uniref:Uncharacterized protein n=1 Tax=Diplogelasinospora grovesii TaxID=303347 RepID=A0AAN6S2X0_9PEZI|nr:hypothetical protein QBC46DRAFT_391155 [Diplogelasinospora grovesii]